MTRVRVESFTISLDGYGAGPNQSLASPLGVGAGDLHQWLRSTRTFQRTLFGKEDGTTGLDDDFAARGFQNVGAWILGRNMFGPVRGDWREMKWKAAPRSISSLELFTRRSTVRASRPADSTCGSAAGRIPSSSTYARASSISCMLRFRRSCSVAENDRSKGLTCGLWDTSALNSQRRTRPLTLFYGTRRARMPSEVMQTTLNHGVMPTTELLRTAYIT